MLIHRDTLLLVLAGLLLVARIQAHADEKVEFVPGQIVIQMQDHALSRADALNDRWVKKISTQLSEVHVVSAPVSNPTLRVLQLQDVHKSQAAIELLKKDPFIKYAEPNYIYHTTREGLPSDTDLDRQWAIRNFGQADSSGQQGTPGVDIDILRVWRKGITGNRRVLVAVIDTGVDYRHPDLKANIWKNPKEIPDNRIDDDQNGFIDDVYGWNFDNDTNDPIDQNGHGSHCAGIIGAQGNNHYGITGVNHQISILPIKFLGERGGTLENAVKSIDYATAMKVDIMSNSWGGGGRSEILKEAIQNAQKAGILFVAAAGNNSSNNDVTATYPANYEVSNLVSVAATDNQDRLASFSNYGRMKVHVAAPGVKIFSTYKDGQFKSLSGTSMATPYVTGIAALLYTRTRDLSPEQIKERLIRTSVPVKSLKSKVQARGRVSAFNFVFNQTPVQPNQPKPEDWISVPYSLASAHPYASAMTESWKIQAPVPARFIRIHFTRIDTELGYDHLTLSEMGGAEFLRFSGNLSDYLSDEVDGDTIQVNLIADSSVAQWGFEIDRIEYVKK